MFCHIQRVWLVKTNQMGAVLVHLDWFISSINHYFLYPLKSIIEN